LLGRFTSKTANFSAIFCHFAVYGYDKSSYRN